MARTAISKKKIKALFARTGNQCAYRGCTEQLVDPDNEPLADICHIEAAGKSGARYNPKMTEEERCSLENLIVLCPNHHRRIDRKPALYDVECLKKMKSDHESQFTDISFQISNAALQKIFEDQLRFQREVNQMNADWRTEFEFAMHLEFSDDPSVHLDSIRESVLRMESYLHEFSNFFDKLPNEIEAFLIKLGYDPTKYRELPYYKNPFFNCYWEVLNIGVTNFLNSIEYHSIALEVHIEYQKIKDHSDDPERQKRLIELRSKLEKLASTTTVAD